MRYLRATAWIACACSILISGCSTTPYQPVGDTEKLWQQQQSLLATLKSWKLKGKIGVKTGSKGGSAKLLWDYTSQAQQIDLSGPFGGGRVVIEQNSDGAILNDTKGKTLKGPDAAAVLYQRLGWEVPFNELVYWARGLPNPGAVNLETDHLGRLTRLQQGIWAVEYLDYRDIEGLQLPRKLNITALPGKLEVYNDKNEYLGDDLRVKVILKRWWNLEFDS